MCGVCGIVSVRGMLAHATADDRTSAMIEALAHRGPDASRLVTGSYSALGATRLSIRGLQASAQPMVDADTGVTVVCNGEIDNHRELRDWLEARGRTVESATDIAVIPGLFLELGDAFVQRLVGEFAVAIWDPRRQRVWLARDRAGERPLFFVVQHNLVRFATEIAALAVDESLTLRLDREALRGYLQFGSFAAPTAPFKEIQKVAPAEIVSIDAGGIQRRRYWRWDITNAPKMTPSLNAFDQIFREAVRRQSDVDVPYGVFLSGGLDSSLVAAVARRVRPDCHLRAYTLRFSEASYDEGWFAQRAAKQLGIEAEPVWVKPESFIDGVGELVRLVGEPLADPAWIPTALLARRAAQDVKLALVGEGADELFAGYPTYLGAQWADRYARLPAALQAAIRRAVEAWPPSEKKVSVSYLLKRFVQAAGMEGLTRHRLWTSNISPDVLTRLGVAPVSTDGEPARDLLAMVQRHDLETLLAEGLLTKADRASMRSALELRAPFLDQAVMEFAATLPVGERVRSFTTKVFLKRYARRYLPAEIIYRRKRGLSVPLSAWLRGPLYDWSESRLRSPRLDDAGVDRRAAVALLEEHRQRHADHARALWTLIVLSEWLEWVGERAPAC
jgi:asparagine synthase (glutamine-hydrolysing)